MMEFLECGKVSEIIDADTSAPKTVAAAFQLSAHHRLRSEEGISYCALVRKENNDVVIIMGNNRKEIETWIGLRLPLDAELMELRDIMFH